MLCYSFCHYLFQLCYSVGVIADILCDCIRFKYLTVGCVHGQKAMRERWRILNALRREHLFHLPPVHQHTVSEAAHWTHTQRHKLCVCVSEQK